MLQKNYTVYTTEENPFEQMCQILLSQIDRESNVIKIVFFGPPQNNEEYLNQLQLLNQCTKEHFRELCPLVSYVSQKPLKGMLNAEVVTIMPNENVHLVYGENYMVLDNGISRELITGGILPPDISDTPTVQSNAVFAKLEAILLLEKFPLNSIVRQWNYIENISLFTGNFQNYQAFNDSRSHFYAKTNWPAGFPAATGIGTQSGGIMVEVIAFIGEEGLINRALDNPLQTAAHKYSQGVLLGAFDPCTQKRTTPKFERGRIVGLASQPAIYISGTAAIRGETSLITDDVTEQTRITMENIDHLIAPVNTQLSPTTCEYKLLRIYVKNPSQMEVVRTYMKANYPDIKKIYVCADICRDELLVEIEGIASV
jgi:enamine deaminase RidA (YjgF/YER057c/UK114 family)